VLQSNKKNTKTQRRRQPNITITIRLEAWAPKRITERIFPPPDQVIKVEVDLQRNNIFFLNFKNKLESEKLLISHVASFMRNTMIPFHNEPRI